MKSKVVVITGASRGIGKATAIQFAEEGANLALCCKTEKGRISLENSISGFCQNYFVRNFDISSESSVRDFIAEISSKNNKIDVLINNAAVVYSGKIENISSEIWDELMSVNLKGTFLMTKYSLPHISKGGHIVNVGSNASKVGFPNWSAYCASKFGILG
ncbi:MAG: SDR family NAD(P)-dependent oxidoreductase, partial [Thermodesulfobacteriota bacterium]